MSATEIKNKIHGRLEEMDAAQLNTAWKILKEISQKDFKKIRVDKQMVDHQINIGLKELDKGEGTDFRKFLTEMHIKYGSKK